MRRHATVCGASGKMQTSRRIFSRIEKGAKKPYFVPQNLPFQTGTLNRFASENPEAEDLFG